MSECAACAALDDETECCDAHGLANLDEPALDSLIVAWRE